MRLKLLTHALLIEADLPHDKMSAWEEMSGFVRFLLISTAFAYAIGAKDELDASSKGK